MLATVLKSKIATKVSIAIMDAFVAMRKYISTNLMKHQNLYNLVLDDHKRIDKLENTFNNLKKRRKQMKFILMGKSMMLIQRY